jgi:hypothetical protein
LFNLFQPFAGYGRGARSASAPTAHGVAGAVFVFAVILGNVGGVGLASCGAV